MGTNIKNLNHNTIDLFNTLTTITNTNSTSSIQPKFNTLKLNLKNKNFYIFEKMSDNYTIKVSKNIFKKNLVISTNNYSRNCKNNSFLDYDTINNNFSTKIKYINYTFP